MPKSNESPDSSGLQIPEQISAQSSPRQQLKAERITL
jgi:hypothetical protein